MEGLLIVSELSGSFVSSAVCREGMCKVGMVVKVDAVLGGLSKGVVVSMGECAGDRLPVS